MAAVSLTLKSWSADKKGRHLIMLRIQAQGKTKYSSLGVKVNKRDWSESRKEVKSSHPHYEDINETIKKALFDAEKALYRLQRNGEAVTAALLKSEIEVSDKRKDFWLFADDWLQEKRKREQIHYWRRARAVLRKLEPYAGRPLPWSQLTPALLGKFDTFMTTKLKNSSSTRAIAFRLLKTIVNDAVRIGMISADANPFPQFSMPESKGRPRVKLTLEELGRLSSLQLRAGSPEELARDMYVFSFYIRGARFGDVVRLRWGDIKNGRIEIVTGKNREAMSVEVREEVAGIIDKYRPESVEAETFVFPPLRNANLSTSESEVAAVASVNASVNRSLKRVAKMIGIDKPVSFHSARHTLAHAAYLKGVDTRTIQSVLTHSKPSVTDQYLRELDTHSLDDALNVVYDNQTGHEG